MTDHRAPEDVAAERPPFMPPDTPTYATAAYLGALHYAIGNEHIVAQFRDETGNRYQPGMTLIARMVDEATGADAAFVEAFIGWFNGRVWGSWDA